MLANMGERERERERERANLGSWLLLWNFVVFLFFFVSTRFGWKRGRQYGFVREKSRREKWVEGLEC